MMTQFRGGTHTLLRFGAAIPVVAAMTLLCGFTTREARVPADPPAVTVQRNGFVIEADSCHREDGLTFYHTVRVQRTGFKIEAESCYLENGTTFYHNVRLLAPGFTLTCDQMSDCGESGVYFFLYGNVRYDSDESVFQARQIGIGQDENGRIIPYFNTMRISEECCPVIGRVVVPFGHRMHPLTDDVRTHDGTDIAAPEGTPVLAAFDGRVVESGYDGEHGRGNFIVLCHDNRMVTSYLHLAQRKVEVGDMVLCGMPIGTVGNTGLTAEPHLHFEIAYDGHNIDPESRYNFEFGKTPTFGTVLRCVGIAMPASPSSMASYTLDDVPTTLAAIEKELSALPAPEKKYRMVRLIPEDGVAMGVIADLKDALHRAGIFRIRYGDLDGNDVLKCTLPPALGAEGVCVTEQDIEESLVAAKTSDASVAIKQRNVFAVTVDGTGKIMAGTPGHQGPVALADLKEAVRKFITNPSDDSMLSEKRENKIGLPNGKIMTFRESLGVVTLQPSCSLDYAVYSDVRRTLTDAFQKVREDVARERFGCRLTSLPDWLEKAVYLAVPIRISEAEPVNR